MKSFTQFLKESDIFELSEGIELPLFLKRLNKETADYSEDSLKNYYKNFVLSKSDYENHGSAFGGPTYGAKFKQEDVLDFLKKFPGVTAKELNIAFGGDKNWKNLDLKLSALLKKNLIKKTDQFSTKGKTKFTWFTIEDFEELLKFQREHKIGKIKLTEDVNVNIGDSFLDVFRAKFPTITIDENNANLTQEWIIKYNESLDKDKTLNQFKEYLLANDFSTLNVTESIISDKLLVRKLKNINESCKVGDEIEFNFKFAGDSKLKHKGEIISIKGDKYKVKVLTGEMKGKTTDITADMINEEQINEMFSSNFKTVIGKAKKNLDDALDYFSMDLDRCIEKLNDALEDINYLKIKLK